MARSTWTGRTVVYRYGCPANVDLDPAALEQLRLAHQLGNDLVALWHRHEQAVAEVWASQPAVAAAQRAVADAEQAVAEAMRALAADRQQRRSRTATPAVAARLRQVRAALRDARANAKRQKQAAHEVLAPTFQELTQRWRAARKATYADYCQRRGLFWATYNDVEQRHLRAVAAVAARRRAGRPAESRFRRWDGSGSIVVQLQRAVADPPRAPATLASGTSRWRNFVELPWIDPAEWAALPRAEQRRRRLQRLRIRIGMDADRQPRWCEVPVLLHRPIPTDADITAIRVSRRRLASRHRLSVEVTCRLPAPAPTTRAATVGLDVGWRSMEDGSIRVAIWRSRIATLAAVPTHLQDAVTTYLTGGEVRIPARWVDQWRQVESLASIRAKNLELLRGDLAALLQADPQVADRLGVSPADLARWRSPARFARLAIDQREANDEVAHRLEAWRSQDQHLWTWEANLRDQLTARRRDLYRKLAAALTAAYGTVMVERPFVADVTRRPLSEQTDSQQAQHARWQARLAAPASLLAAVKQAAAARGVAVQELDATQTTRTHHGCGGAADPAQARRQVLVVCPTCGSEFDQDVNAAWWLADGGLTAAPTPQ